MARHRQSSGCVGGGSPSGGGSTATGGQTAGRHSPSLPGRQTAASAGNIVSREYLIAGKTVGSVSREYRQQGSRAARKIVSRAASSAGQIGRWLRRQGRSATSGRCIGADDISGRCIGEDVSAQMIYREDVSAKIGSRAPNRRRTVRLREQRAASHGVAGRREQGSRAASLAGQITPSATSVAGRQVGIAGRCFAGQGGAGQGVAGQGGVAAARRTLDLSPRVALIPCEI